MNWTDHIQYSAIFQEFIHWYKGQVDAAIFYSLSDKEAKNIDAYLQIPRPESDNAVIFQTAKDTYLAKAIPTMTGILKAKTAPAIDKSDWTCVYCEETATTVDHIIPLGKGGTENKENLAHSCYPCNNLKSDMSLSDFVSHLDKLIVQSHEMGNDTLAGKYGLMMFNATKLLHYEDKNYAKMFSGTEVATKRHKSSRIQKRSLRNPLNGITKPKPEPTGTPIDDSLNKSTPVGPSTKLKPHIPPKEKETPELNYLDKEISVARAAGFDKLWKYQLAHPETWAHRIPKKPTQ